MTVQCELCHWQEILEIYLEVLFPGETISERAKKKKLLYDLGGHPLYLFDICLPWFVSSFCIYHCAVSRSTIFLLSHVKVPKKAGLEYLPVLT